MSGLPKNICLTPSIDYLDLSEVISSFSESESWVTGVVLLMLFICMILWSGKSLPLLYILPFGILCLSAMRMMFEKIIYWQCFVGGYGGLTERGLGVFRKLGQVGFLVVRKS